MSQGVPGPSGSTSGSVPPAGNGRVTSTRGRAGQADYLPERRAASSAASAIRGMVVSKLRQLSSVAP